MAGAADPQKKKAGKADSLEFRLERYYTAVDLSGLILPLVVAAGIYLFPWLFPWILFQRTTISIFLLVVIANAANLLLYQVYRKKVFFHMNRYIFMALFMYFILVSGGIHSDYLFLLLFPVMVSAVDLDPRMTRRVGIAICSYIALLIVLNHEVYSDTVLLTDLVLRLALFVTLSSYMYLIVRETLRQKYERDEAGRRLTRLVEVEELKNDFLSVAQHQLRTPLSGIRYALETLHGDATLSASGRELADSSIARVKDALDIVNEMLTTAETGMNDLVLHKEPVDLAKLLGSIIDELGYVAKQKEADVRVHMPDSLIIPADQKRLKPALTNIIDNALKYSPGGDVDIVLAPGTSDKGRPQALLIVKDTGIGMSPEDLAFAFNRLHRGQNAISLEPDQSGVGLYTAKHMIELHGGTIALESALGHGTTVTIALPM